VSPRDKQILKQTNRSQLQCKTIENYRQKFHVMSWTIIVVIFSLIVDFKLQNVNKKFIVIPSPM